MFSTTTLLAYIAACFVLAIVPGPTVTVIISSSLARGTKAGLMNILGTQIGMLTMVVVVAFGLEAVIGFMGWARLVNSADLTLKPILRYAAQFN